MKLIASAVTFSAAIVRSPSFSRSSSSTTTIIFPARMSSITSDTVLLSIRPSLGGTGSESARGQEPLHVLRDDIGLEVDEAARLGVPQVRYLESIRDQSDRED